MQPSSSKNLALALWNRLQSAFNTAIVLAVWFASSTLVTGILTSIADGLLIWIFDVNLGFQFCLFFGKIVGPYDTLIDPLPFYFFVGISGGALAVLFKIRSLMSAD